MDLIKKAFDKVKSNKLIKVELIVILFCLILGTLLHFTYEWSGENLFIGSFSAVNESVWEHLKLLVFPMTLMSIVGIFVVKKQSENYWVSQVLGIITAMLFVVIFFYTYTGIIGRNITILDIGSFIVGIILGEYVAYKILETKKEIKAETPSILLLIVIIISFIIFTIYPPIIPLFEDPIYGTFGLEPKRID